MLVRANVAHESTLIYGEPLWEPAPDAGGIAWFLTLG
jgi:hypothetical protein